MKYKKNKINNATALRTLGCGNGHVNIRTCFYGAFNEIRGNTVFLTADNIFKLNKKKKFD